MWSEDDVKNRNIVEEGDYPFEILSAIKRKTNSKDKDGNPKPVHDMLELDYSFYDSNGVVKKIKDWVVFMEGMDWKLRHIAEAIGKLDMYEERVLDIEHLIKGKGIFKIAIKTDTYKGEERKINYIKDYVRISEPTFDLNVDIPQ
jgi:hypothetical protein